MDMVYANIIFQGFIVFAIGACIGSFITCWGYRNVHKISIVLVSHSYCESCRAKLGFFDLLPIVNYIKNRGKCSKCKKPYSILSTVVELVTAVYFVGLYVFVWNPFIAATLALAYSLTALSLVINITRGQVLRSKISVNKLKNKYPSVK